MGTHVPSAVSVRSRLIPTMTPEVVLHILGLPPQVHALLFLTVLCACKRLSYGDALLLGFQLGSSRQGRGDQ